MLQLTAGCLDLTVGVRVARVRGTVEFTVRYIFDVVCVYVLATTYAWQRKDWLLHKAECKGIAAIQPHVPTDTMRLVARALQKKV